MRPSASITEPLNGGRARTRQVLASLFVATIGGDEVTAIGIEHLRTVVSHTNSADFQCGLRSAGVADVNTEDTLDSASDDVRFADVKQPHWVMYGSC